MIKFSTFLGASALALAASSAATAATYRVDLGGLLTGSFDVDTAAAAVQHLTTGGLALTGYTDAAISNVSLALGGTNLGVANIQDRFVAAGATPVAVYFSQALAAGATPQLSMLFSSGLSFAQLGTIACLTPTTTCAFSGRALVYVYSSGLFTSGPETASVSSLGGVPEPATWVLMLVGVGSLGASLRGRRGTAVAV